MVSFRDILYPPITLERFKALRASDPKRICFGSIHKNALKRGDGGRAAGWFNVPFAETISSVFPWELFRNTKGKFGGYYRAVSDDHEFSEISQWLAENADVVFIRSLFKTAVAACEHYITADRRSRVGELEHSAKYEGDTRACEALVDILEGVYPRCRSGRFTLVGCFEGPQRYGQPIMSPEPKTHCVRKGDADYPARLLVVLGDRAPERLYLRGNRALLDEHAISFCGARDASEKGIEAAAICARTAAQKHFVITSGNARGVDRATHREALIEGGATVIVLPEGMNHFRIAPELRDAWDWSRVLVVSQFDEAAVWRSYNAMDRNKTIMALSCAMIVVEAGEKGGTRSAGEDALRLRIPLFAIDYGFDEEVAPGNRELIKRGAKPLKKSRESGQPNLTDLLSDAEKFCADVRSRSELAHHGEQPKLI